MTEAYPLHWPPGQPRTPPYQRNRARFDTSQDMAQRGLMEEIKRLGGRNPVLSTMIRIRNDGMPYVQQSRIEDPGVAVYFSYKGTQMCFACDKWDLIKDNMQAIRKTIEALRGIERWGSGDMMERAFTGFTALPAPGKRPWYAILGVDPTANLETVDSAWRKRIAETHPDKGGNPEEFQAVQDAKREAYAERGMA